MATRQTSLARARVTGARNATRFQGLRDRVMRAFSPGTSDPDTRAAVLSDLEQRLNTAQSAVDRLKREHQEAARGATDAREPDSAKARDAILARLTAARRDIENAQAALTLAQERTRAAARSERDSAEQARVDRLRAAAAERHRLAGECDILLGGVRDKLDRMVELAAEIRGITRSRELQGELNRFRDSLGGALAVRLAGLHAQRVPFLAGEDAGYIQAYVATGDDAVDLDRRAGVARLQGPADDAA